MSFLNMILAAYSKFFSGPTIELAYQNQNPVSFVTLVPKTIGLREEFVNPAGTSQTCICGFHVPKSVR